MNRICRSSCINNNNINLREQARDLGVELSIIWDRENSPEWADYLEEVRRVYQKYHRRWLKNRIYAVSAASLA